MERETRFELATSTLARLRSTTELFPHNIIGADEGSRTPTPKAPDPKSGASANSATSALNYLFGGGWWIRTTEVSDNRFTVCPLWPLGKSSVYGASDRNRTYNLLITSQLLYRWATLAYLAGITGLEPVTHWLTVNCSTNWAIFPHIQLFGDLEGTRTLDLQRDRLAF